uniref:Uncharacterized protein n=1 Tax=Avena sativa TaxID=4498 RepID=A0ACD5WKA4_AVESA
MRKLRDNVEKLSSCLHDLSEAEDPPTMAKRWMNEARDLSYDMDDYINELFLRPAKDPCLAADNIKTTRFRHKWFSHVKTRKKLTWDEQIEGIVSEFRMYVTDALKRHEVYDLKIFSTGRVVSVGRMLTMPYKESSDIVINGRMNEFINSLVPDDGANQLQLKVVSILGSSCFGKTTLARVLYNKLGKQYSCRAFIRASKKPDMKRIFHDILSQLQRQDPPQYCNEIDLINNIERYLRDKRYLVIIDDLWDTTAWDIISRAFPNGTHHSRIITTTQIEDVAFRCCRYQSEDVFEMKPLDDAHSRKLFFNRLFGSENACPQPLKEILYKIVQICGGLPLAIISIASLLASQPDMSEHILKHIHESLSSSFSASSTSERTRQALNLSFNNLPNYLKTCLLYLSIYPEGNIFWRYDLLKQWMAENFIDTKGQDMEEVAGSYLDELVARRFIHPICVNYNNEVLSFAVHDTIHDLIAHKSAEMNFIVAVDDSRTNVLLSHQARRLSLLFGDARYAKIPANIRKSQARSLTYSGFFECMPSITEFKLLRILNLQLCDHGRYDDPVDLTGISELFQLKYLKIASDVCIKLPNHWVQGLDTLDIMDARLVCVPSDIHLSHLLHLSLPVAWSLSMWMFDKLNYLQELHLSTSSHFSHLEESMKALGSLINGHCNLKTIVVAYGPRGEKNVVRGASKVMISWDYVAPPHFLQRFEFLPHNRCIFHRIPKWIEGLDYLSVLKIAVEELQEGCVNILGGLPALTVLSLYVLKGSLTAPYNKVTFYKAVGFSVLKYFKLKFASGIPQIEFEKDAMPKLWKLKLVFNGMPPKEEVRRLTVKLEHMKSLIEISVKFIGGAVGQENFFVDNSDNNPSINKQSVVSSSFSDESRKQKEQLYEILEEERVEFDKKFKSRADQRNPRLLKTSSRPHVPGVSIRGRSRVGKMGPPMSASLGATRHLVWKMDKLLRAPPLGCSSNSVQEGMRKLRDNVEKLSSCLHDLSDVEDPPPTAKFWMNEARDLSYKMEDYIDSLIFVQPADPYLVAHNINMTRSFYKWFSHAKTRKRDVQIAATVSEFKKDARKAIKAWPGVGTSPTLRRRYVSLGPMLPVPTTCDDIVIDDRMNEFIDSVTNNEEQQLKVASILGSDCLGKTTLARVLYNKLGKRYHYRAFIRVSKRPDTKVIFRDILSQLQQQDPPEYRNEVDLIHNIQKYLQHKRYLIIIDDLWDASIWDNINHAFPKGTHGSRIVTITKIKDVALACCCYQPELVFEMKPLDNDHSRKLFFNRFFGSETDCPEIFRESSNKIIETCGGLPFATISIASLLASQPVITEDLLKDIHASLSYCFLASSTLERTRQALNLSFNNLPHCLKTCLLYLSLYPQGYTFCKDDLVKQWIAEGFIDTTEDQDMEKVAESYLHQLVNRRFIHPICVNYKNEVLSCVIHDVLHDLIAHKSAEEHFIVAIECNENSAALSHKARRISLLCGDAKTQANIRKSQVRSLTFFGIFQCMPCITEYKLLRVLNLHVSGHGGEDNPVDLTGISELTQLRYLKIGCGLCVKLPTHGLKCLETLDITDAIVTGSSWCLALPHLLHAALSFESSLPCGIGVLGDCVEELHLTSSCTRSYELEINIRELCKLIRGRGNLRTVVIVAHGSTAKITMVSGASIVITALDDLEPSPLLQRFECAPSSGITFSRTPKWVKDLHNLCTLKITVRIVQKDCVHILSGLRALSDLSLYVRWQSIERIIFDKAGFLSLKYFKLRYTSGIAWIKFEADAMPNLLKLRLVFSAIPRMDMHPYFISTTNTGRIEQYKRGNALIVIEHMPRLGDMYVKFGGATADLERIKEIGISVDPNFSPAVVKVLFVDSGSDGDQRMKLKQQEEKHPADETLDRAASQRSPESLYVFTLDELMSATTNFSRAHFQGDHYREMNLNRTFCRPGVYKGYFTGNFRPGLKPQRVAVKCLNKFSDGHEWMKVDQTELEYLAKVCHPNLVKLLGFCDYDEHRMLVYESMPAKSLKQYLLEDFHSKEELLTWLSRLKIAVGVAKGLAFLHQADKPMVHGDFKASAILLVDSSVFIPKLFGFCLARESPPGEKTVESDVYNFGVVLLQLLLLVKPPRGPHEVVAILDHHRNKLLHDAHKALATLDHHDKLQSTIMDHPDKLQSFMDPRLEGQWLNAVTIARQCMDSMPEKRPSMRDVLQDLEQLLRVAHTDMQGDDIRPTGSSGGMQQQSTNK